MHKRAKKRRFSPVFHSASVNFHYIADRRLGGEPTHSLHLFCTYICRAEYSRLTGGSLHSEGSDNAAGLHPDDRGSNEGGCYNGQMREGGG